ncbi:hypothetical protein AYI69_g3862 [Smittium culicis]|uniref:Uncharacterized protein n=1 Tax=Smittium culicis TaxID=133412 RepID=A0A1R1YIG8_9FUNG|nr:hypothetical protein AYI69_g3862 [Smittium culicis]
MTSSISRFDKNATTSSGKPCWTSCSVCVFFDDVFDVRCFGLMKGILNPVVSMLRPHILSVRLDHAYLNIMSRHFTGAPFWVTFADIYESFGAVLCWRLQNGWTRCLSNTGFLLLGLPIPLDPLAD